jgi:hypothetical protein
MNVEGPGSSVEHCGEDSARVRQAVHDLDQGQEIAHDHVAEHHVEEQLSVRPPRAVAGPGEFFLAGGFEQRMEGRLRPFELCTNRLAVAILTVQRMLNDDSPLRNRTSLGSSHIRSMGKKACLVASTSGGPAPTTW